jgi:T-complex protein 1 subunit alpha
VVAGGGAVECGLSIYLEDFARTIASRESHAVLEFAEALLVSLGSEHVVCRLLALSVLSSLVEREPKSLYHSTLIEKNMPRHS